MSDHDDAKPGGDEQPDHTASATDVPNQETGVGIGADEESTTFEPEEDPEATEDPEAGGGRGADEASGATATEAGEGHPT